MTTESVAANNYAAPPWSDPTTTDDAKVVGKLFTLPAGDVGVAVGVASRKETLSGTGPKLLQCEHGSDET